MNAPRVVLCCDRGFARPAGVALQSLLETHAEAPQVSLFAAGLEADDVRRFEATARAFGAALDVREVDPARLRDVPRSPRFGLATYFRLLMPELLEGPRALYLDVDILVEGDLAPLWGLDLEGAAAAAVPNLLEQVRRHPELGLSPAHAYFNAGVLLADLDAWRRERVAERALDFLRRVGDKALFLDQDALNVALQERVRPLSCVWNFMPWLGETRFQDDYHAIEFGHVRPAVVHFAGDAKPWTSNAKDDVWAARWRACLRRTPWAS